jgi:hypothetical protein
MATPANRALKHSTRSLLIALPLRVFCNAASDILEHTGRPQAMHASYHSLQFRHVSIERLRNVCDIGEISLGATVPGILGKEDVTLKLVLADSAALANQYRVED